MTVRRVLLLLPVLALLLLGGLYVLLDTWLESAGGRRAVERALSERSGMPVTLNGEFDIMLLPAPGVSGTELLVLDPLRGDVLARGGRFAVALELLPLFREQLEIRQLTVGDLHAGPPGAELHIEELGLSAYAQNQPTDLYVELGEQGRIEGWFTWFPSRLAIDFAVDWKAPGDREGSLASTVSWSGSRFSLADINAELAGQRIRGHGCFELGTPPVLNLLLSSEMLDFDLMSSALPQTAGEGGMESFELPLELNLVLDVDQFLGGDVRAENVTLELGRQPTCPD